MLLQMKLVYPQGTPHRMMEPLGVLYVHHSPYRAPQKAWQKKDVRGWIGWPDLR